MLCDCRSLAPIPAIYRLLFDSERGSKILCGRSRVNPLLPLSRPEERSAAKRQPSPIAGPNTVPHGPQVLYRNPSEPSIMTGYLIVSDQTLAAFACKEQDSSPCQLIANLRWMALSQGDRATVSRFFSPPGLIPGHAILARALWSATAQNGNEKKELSLQRKKKHSYDTCYGSEPSPLRSLNGWIISLR